ncbi:MAG: enoyl-ACP reductase, partial [Magnetococcales bacterium]|nr:enoyl-ACP reductase [Magnetococcales bacterium]
LGVANDRSIAWGIAQACHREGATLGFTFLGESLEKRVRPLAAELGSTLVESCNVTVDEDLDALFDQVKRQWGQLDFMVHSVAFAKKQELKGYFYDTSREGFQVAMETSVFSLVSATRRAVPLMSAGGTILTLSYLGAERVMPHYNVMGVAKAALEASVRYLAVDLGNKAIRINAISAGPIKTLAAAGIGDFKEILNWNQDNAPLRRNVSIQEVGETALYLLSDMSSGVTGEVLHLDAGYHIVGMKSVDLEAEAQAMASSAATGSSSS